MALDPVCHMEVDPETAADYAEYKGKTYYFCSMACAEQFEQDPERFAGQELKKPPQGNVA